MHTHPLLAVILPQHRKKAQEVLSQTLCKMDLSRRDFRAMIFYDYKKSLMADECHSSLLRVFGEAAPSRATVGNWFREFSRGR